VSLEGITLHKDSSKYVDTKAFGAMLQKSLCLGIHNHMIYAVECFADDGILSVDFVSTAVPLLEGPNYEFTKNDLVFGDAHIYYSLPQASEIQLHYIPETEKQDFKEFIMSLREPSSVNSDQTYKECPTTLFSNDNVGPITVSISQAITLMITGYVTAVAMWLMYQRKIKDISPPTHGDKMCIGKVSYDVQLVLGHGSHGTVVFKGAFEKRPVAVKRILPECYEMADHEVKCTLR
jgi:hypothetical protein